MNRHTRCLTLAAVSVLLAACASPALLPEQDPSRVESRQPDAISVDTARVVKVQPDKVVTHWNAVLTDPRSPLSRRIVYFDYDAHVVKEEFHSLLAAHGRFLADNPSASMRIQGNTDEHGTREYNIALGQRRADAVRKALLLLGAKEDQIEAISYGEEMPACTEPSEGCRARNRRGEVLYSGEF